MVSVMQLISFFKLQLIRNMRLWMVVKNAILSPEDCWFRSQVTSSWILQQEWLEFLYYAGKTHGQTLPWKKAKAKQQNHNDCIQELLLGTWLINPWEVITSSNQITPPDHSSWKGACCSNSKVLSSYGESKQIYPSKNINCLWRHHDDGVML